MNREFSDGEEILEERDFRFVDAKPLFSDVIEKGEGAI
jgi:hypothetical protein